MFPLEVKRMLLAAFSAANGFARPVRLEDVTFGLASLWLQGSCNTRITITAKTGNGFFSGSQVLHYTRRRLDHYLLGLKIPGERSTYTTVHEVVEALVATYGVPVSIEEIINDPLDTNATTATLRPVSNSLGWLSSYPATLHFRE